jgi:hypothetical protein
MITELEKQVKIIVTIKYNNNRRYKMKKITKEEFLDRVRTSESTLQEAFTNKAILVSKQQSNETAIIDLLCYSGWRILL